MQPGRTKLSFLNSKVSLIYYLIGLILDFISRKIFIVSLGADVVGLNTTAVNLLGFLNIAELGIGAAVAVTLYKPLFDHNYEKINDIVSLQGFLYKRIALFVLIGGGVLMLFFPLIFRKITIPIWYAYASFGVLLYGSLLTYIYNYKQIILSADQKNYLILFYYKTIILIGTIFQIILLKIFTNGYIWWLIIQFIFPTLATLSLSYCIKNKFPKIEKSKKRFKLLLKQYPSVVSKIKQVFFHKISTYVLLQSSPLVLYFFTDLKMVTIYGNYMIICLGIIRLLGAIFSSMGASIGNLIAEDNYDKIIRIFKEIFSIRFNLVTSLCFVFYCVIDQLIQLWVGSQYILNHTIMILIVFYLFQNSNRTTVDNFLQGYGLYKDIYAPIIEATINLGLSIVLGMKFGLIGILIAINLSLFIIVGCWKPYFLYKNGFKTNISQYIMIFAKHSLCLLLTWPICWYVYTQIFVDMQLSVMGLIIQSVFCATIFFSLITIISYFIAPGTKEFFQHMKLSFIKK